MSEQYMGDALIANAERLFGVKAKPFKPLDPLSNGTVIEFKQYLPVISLIDVEKEWQSGRFLKIRKGERCLVHHTRPSCLALGKSTQARNFRLLKDVVVEGVDFEVIPDALPYPREKSHEENTQAAENTLKFMKSFSSGKW